MSRSPCPTSAWPTTSSMGTLSRREPSCYQTYGMPLSNLAPKRHNYECMFDRACMHDPEVYPNPDDFIPERFMQDGALDASVRDPFNYIFGFGRRSVPVERYHPERVGLMPMYVGSALDGTWPKPLFSSTSRRCYMSLIYPLRWTTMETLLRSCRRRRTAFSRASFLRQLVTTELCPPGTLPTVDALSSPVRRKQRR